MNLSSFIIPLILKFVLYLNYTPMNLKTETLCIVPVLPSSNIERDVVCIRCAELENGKFLSLEQIFQIDYPNLQKMEQKQNMIY